MSPLSLRRYRAERLLRQEFDALRSEVLRSVRGRLRACGIRLDEVDLEACYAQAWQGLYMSLLAGEEVASVRAWLATVSFRRALDEHRARARCGGPVAPGLDVARGHRPAAWREPAEDPDLARELDERTRLRHLFEGLRGRLGPREREAAALCYLQGLSRADAAARMGISASNMRKLMDGRGAGRPGVAEKVGRLVETIREGRWCEEQGSLMRGLAYGILDPDGERYELARAHRSECASCRAYVLSLRGLSAALPPVLVAPGLISVGLGSAGAGALAGVRAGALGPASAGAGPAAGTGAAGSALGVGAAGASGAGGGWMIAGGGLGAKLALGCALALGVGAGCAAISGVPGGEHAQRHPRATAPARAVMEGGASRGPEGSSAGADAAARTAVGAHAGGGSSVQAPVESAPREFGPEQALASGPTSASRRPRTSRVEAATPVSTVASLQSRSPSGTGAERSTPSSGAAMAIREFGLG